MICWLYEGWCIWVWSSYRTSLATFHLDVTFSRVGYYLIIFFMRLPILWYLCMNTWGFIPTPYTMRGTYCWALCTSRFFSPLYVRRVREASNGHLCSFTNIYGTLNLHLYGLECWSSMYSMGMWKHFYSCWWIIEDDFDMSHKIYEYFLEDPVWALQSNLVVFITLIWWSKEVMYILLHFQVKFFSKWEQVLSKIEFELDLPRIKVLIPHPPPGVDP